MILIYYIHPTIMTGLNMPATVGMSATVEEKSVIVEEMSVTMEEMSTTVDKLNMFKTI